MDKRLLEILNSANFAVQYHDLIKTNEQNMSEVRMTTDEILSILNSGPLSFTYNKKERFYKHLDTSTEDIYQLNIVLSDTKIEFILFIEVPSSKFKGGGPFGALYKKLDKSEKLNRKIAYSTIENVSMILAKGIDLFIDIKKATISHLTQ